VSLAGRLLLAAWAGLLLTLGAVVAPTLFVVLADRHLAGFIAGNLFRTATVISAAMAAALVLLAARAGGEPARARQTQAVVPAILLSASEWLIRPQLDAARADGGAGGGAFAAWHAVSSGLYWLATVWVVVALVRELRGEAARS
jgi:hypothetical protein